MDQTSDIKLQFTKSNSVSIHRKPYSSTLNYQKGH